MSCRPRCCYFHSCVLRCGSSSAVFHCAGGFEVPDDADWSHHGQLSVGLHEVLEERDCGVAKRDVHVDDVQLPGWAY